MLKLDLPGIIIAMMIFVNIVIFIIIGSYNFIIDYGNILVKNNINIVIKW